MNKKRTAPLLIALLLLVLIIILYYKCRDEGTPDKCTNLIFVAVNRIPEEQYNEWQETNQMYMYDVPTKKTVPGTSEGIVAIDATKIEPLDYAAWLKANSRFIFYEGTYPYIECVHSINEAEISGLGSFSPLTLQQLKTQIASKGGNFYADHYNRYTSVSLSSSGAVLIDLQDDFDVTKNCYSLPLLQSIVSEHALNNSSVFEFAVARVNKKRTIIFRIQDAGGLYNYYDFSQVPP